MCCGGPDRTSRRKNLGGDCEQLSWILSPPDQWWPDEMGKSKHTSCKVSNTKPFCLLFFVKVHLFLFYIEKTHTVKTKKADLDSDSDWLQNSLKIFLSGHKFNFNTLFHFLPLFFFFCTGFSAIYVNFVVLYETARPRERSDPAGNCCSPERCVGPVGEGGGQGVAIWWGITSKFHHFLDNHDPVWLTACYHLFL